jgi:hypothetical protein
MDIFGAQGLYCNFSDSVPVTAMSYVTGQWLAQYWAGVSSGSLDEFDVANPSGSPSSGAYQDCETVQFTANRSSTTHNPTIKLGTRAAVPIIPGNSFPGPNTNPFSIFHTNAAAALANTTLVGSTGTALSNSSIVGSGGSQGQATVTTASPHGFVLGSQQSITLAGVTPTGFNGTFTCTVTGVSAFVCPNSTSGTASVVGTYQVGFFTVTTAVAHGLTTSTVYTIAIAGTTETGCASGTTCFSGTFSCVVTGTTTFTCPTTNTSASATTPGTWQLLIASGDIISTTFTASYLPGGTYTFVYYPNTTQTGVAATVAAGTNIMTVTAVNYGTVTPGQVPGNGVTSFGALSTTPVVLPYGTAGTTGTGGIGTYALTSGYTTLQNVTSLQGQFGPETSTSNLRANWAQAFALDPVVPAYGIACGNNPNIPGETCFSEPLLGTLTVTGSTSGAGAESFATGTVQIGGSTSGGNTGFNSGSSYTLQYSVLLGGFVNVGTGLGHGSAPYALAAEVSNRANIGAWISSPIAFTYAAWGQLGAWAAANMPGHPIVGECGNEIWNNSEAEAGRSQALAQALGLGYGGFNSSYSYQSLCTAQALANFASSYIAAGGSAANVHPLLLNWSLSALTQNADNFTMVPAKWNSGFLAATSTFSGTFGTTNGINTVAVSGLSSGNLLSAGLVLTGTCISGNAHLIGTYPSRGGSPSANGTWQIDTPQSGSCTVTATNPLWANFSGPAGTPNSINYNVFPNRAIDIVDGVGWATYHQGALAGQGSGSWNNHGLSSSAGQALYANLFTGSANYAQGIATSNPTLVASGLSAWAADVVSGGVNGSFGQNNTINFYIGQGAYTAPGAAVSSSFETDIKAYDGARPSGKANLFVALYEGSPQQTLASNGDNGTVGSLSPNGAVFTCSQSGTTMTATGVTGTVVNGDQLYVQGTNTVLSLITGQSAGTVGGAGTYSMSGSATVSSGTACNTASSSAVAMAAQFNTNGWTALDATYGYPGFGSGSMQTAINVTNLFLGYVQSTTFYHTELCFLQEMAAVHSARPHFYGALFGIVGSGSITVPGAALWGDYTGTDINSPKEQNWYAMRDFDSGVTATCP